MLRNVLRYIIEYMQIKKKVFVNLRNLHYTVVGKYTVYTV